MRKTIIATIITILFIFMNSFVFTFEHHKGEVLDSFIQNAKIDMVYQGEKQDMPINIRIKRIVSTEPEYKTYARDSRGIPAGDYETWKEKFTYNLDLPDWDVGWFTLYPSDNVYIAKPPVKPPVEPSQYWKRLNQIRTERNN